MVYYSVSHGLNPGIYTTWKECQKNISGYSKAVFKKFNDLDSAKKFLKDNSKTHNKNNNITNKSEKIVVYTDGACSNNGSSIARAGFGVYFGENDSRNVSKKVEGKQTNNVAELSAIIEVSDILKKELRLGYLIEIWTDSEYSIKCCTNYGKKQDDNGWEKNIKNKKLVKKAYTTFKKYSNVEFKYIKAHTDKKDIHSIGNDQADKLANLAIGLESCPYQDNEIKNKIFLDIPFSQKDKAKALGANWDIDEKKWFIKNKKITESSYLFDDNDIKLINNCYSSIIKQ